VGVLFTWNRDFSVCRICLTLQLISHHPQHTPRISLQGHRLAYKAPSASTSTKEHVAERWERS
jgi:hypothetical protein